MTVRLRLFYLALVGLHIGLLGVWLGSNKIIIGGDIAEYWGTTEAIVNHQSLEVREGDLVKLKMIFGEGAVNNSEYFLEANNGQKYTGHFWFYSVLLTALRPFFGLKAFGVLNWLIFSLVNVVIVVKLTNGWWEKIIYSLLVGLSPMLSFLSWPGIEVYCVMGLILGVFLFFRKSRWRGEVLMALAAWQSLPLLVVPIFFGVVDLGLTIKEKKLNWPWLGSRMILGIIALLPNFYYFWLYGTYHAQAKLPGMGMVVDWRKLVEVVFDLNLGLFWYWPVGIILGLVAGWRRWWVVILMLGIEILYSGTTNWNHGTAGWGPSRYGLMLMPFLVWVVVDWVGRSSTFARNNFFVPVKCVTTLNGSKKCYFTCAAVGSVLLIFGGGWQLMMMTLNGGLFPEVANSFAMNPLAKAVLEYKPEWYNPSIEIFLKRTGGTGIYWGRSGRCRKVVLVKSNEEWNETIRRECGGLDLKIDPIEDKKLKIREATLWPIGDTCRTEMGNCLLGIDSSRIEAIEGVVGAWKINKGKLVTIAAPLGYQVDYDPPNGVYVNIDHEDD